jgi:hypothetical protein
MPEYCEAQGHEQLRGEILHAEVCHQFRGPGSARNQTKQAQRDRQYRADYQQSCQDSFQHDLT